MALGLPVLYQIGFLIGISTITNRTVVITLPYKTELWEFVPGILAVWQSNVLGAKGVNCGVWQ